MGFGRERTSTTPMDFEFSNGTGTVGDSPFAALSQAQAKKRKLSSFASTRPLENQAGPLLIEGPDAGQTGQRSAFDSSPTKNTLESSNRLHLREPHNQSVLFSQNTKPLPAVPQHVANPWAPRTPSQQSIYDSSDAGTPNTPGVNDDSEAATPEQTADRMASRSGKTPKRRESWFRNVFSSSPSPEKSKKAAYFSRKAESKVMKRRKQKQIALRDEFDSDDEQQRQTQKGAQSTQAQAGVGATVGSFFSYLDSHPNLPATLSFWLQLSVNCCLALFFLYIVWQAWSSVMSDVDVESSKHLAEVMVQISDCSKQYRDNNCDPKVRVPAMQNLCGNWEQCMSQDPKKVAKARVGAKAFAMIFNAFVEEFSYKSMVCTIFIGLLFLGNNIFFYKFGTGGVRHHHYHHESSLQDEAPPNVYQFHGLENEQRGIFTAILIFGGFNLSNWAFGLIRSKQSQPHPSLQHHDSFNYPPQTPHRHPSGGYLEQPPYTQWHTPYQTPYGSMNQGMIQQAAQSMPALPSLLESAAGAGAEIREKSTAKRSLFR
ncbi:Di-sulfide bridge nucleocytoplasmic transport domain-containing protein [Lophiotrema nucula]|uniref:Di-sulfide bridge nucleocytoplasmic transport domain-containing protein n=1 Tax=Lophiotrema nucula TaxID=690887 RepID=A0A6A5ZAG2_9PLEO|nr:Di-sulfide bridge nucleocytoplasmic transport domain-containing protein [Lophiotrema nucula]